jgi:hypothetical protein
VIQTLLAEANGAPVSGGVVQVAGTGVQAVSNQQDVESPETYIGYGRAERFIGTMQKDRSASYSARPEALDAWGLNGVWSVGEEHAGLDKAGDQSPTASMRVTCIWCWGRGRMGVRCVFV